MADRMLYIGWDEPVRGREERAVEVFNEALGILGRKQQDGAIESFDVALFAPNGQFGGFMKVEGTAAQLAALKDDAEFERNTVDATLCVEGIRHIDGYTNEGVAQQMALYTQAAAQVPQAH